MDGGVVGLADIVISRTEKSIAERVIRIFLNKLFSDRESLGFESGRLELIGCYI